MADNKKIQDLMKDKEKYIQDIKSRGEMQISDMKSLSNLDEQIYFEQHPRVKKFRDWLFPKAYPKNRVSNFMKRAWVATRNACIFPVVYGYHAALDIKRFQWNNKNVAKHAPDKKGMFWKRLAAWSKSWGFGSAAQTHSMSDVVIEKKQAINRFKPTDLNALRFTKPAPSKVRATTARSNTNSRFER